MVLLRRNHGLQYTLILCRIVNFYDCTILVFDGPKMVFDLLIRECDSLAAFKCQRHGFSGDCVFLDKKDVALIVNRANSSNRPPVSLSCNDNTIRLYMVGLILIVSPCNAFSRFLDKNAVLVQAPCSTGTAHPKKRAIFLVLGQRRRSQFFYVILKIFLIARCIGPHDFFQKGQNINVFPHDLPTFPA